MTLPQPPQALPCHFVIFGATGDLSALKLLPALYHLEAGGHLPAGMSIIALGRRPWSEADWLRHLEGSIRQRMGEQFSARVYRRFAARFTYVAGDLHDPALYQTLSDRLCADQHCADTVFYLSIKPSDFGAVIQRLDQAGLNRPRGLHRIVVEKPFGEDVDSARQLNRLLHDSFDEEQIYRIDHYLGKETVQNLLVFRFANTLIEPLWNRNYIDHVQISVAEQAGISTRADYYDKAGALRDMLQNHLLQLLTLVAMEPPPALEADALRDEKVKVLRSIRPIPEQAIHAHAFRAQYGPGSIDGAPVPGYQDEPGVAPHSVAETFVAAKFYVDNWRWRGVPFYLRTGKRLARQLSLIAIRFRHPPQQLFRETPLEFIEPNWVLLSLQPSESMHIELHSKQPGLGMDTRIIRLDASYRRGREKTLEAYETLLLDIMEGDRSLFLRFDEVEWAWRVVDPILRHWTRQRDFIRAYPAGSWGPPEADRLFDKPEQSWRNQL
ncbi:MULTISPECIES: glucose-6-phosphate dehydrogenase [Methylococcus]|uniref:Glucose-6-phosphate 1-dehydrogenase n=1 Tax=Methylococcus capsulatus TaxID=414 RepID=A0ABZ2F8E7_METCP|nr:MULTISPECIES: glucose-6-phosphate dehydrogenase [Methylococcus]MDF9393038.1 glucose-6-phosphate dehydrogenase [Methylococcus capsulatus]